MDSLGLSDKLRVLKIEQELVRGRWFKSGFSDEDAYTDIEAIEDEIQDIQYALMHQEGIHGYEGDEHE